MSLLVSCTFIRYSIHGPRRSNKTTQKILDITNHVAKKYHIEFGATKCKVLRIGTGAQSQLHLNGQILEESENYRYLGEIFNNKGNMEAHITELEKKIQAATSKIITEASNEESCGMKMQAIWQMQLSSPS